MPRGNRALTLAAAVIAYLWVFLVSAGATFLATPLVRLLAVRVGAIDEPSDRKVHPRATPTMGGVAMWVGLLAGLGLSRTLPFFGPMNRGSSEPLAAVVTCTLFVALGAVDDLKGIRALTKLTGQIFIAGVLVLMGVQIVYLFFPGSFQIVYVGPDLAVPYTILWVVAIVNAVNLVDGLDGLAAGMVAIAAGSFFAYMVRTPSLFGEASAAALLACVTAGVCLGFLPWNFHPARIFMGDTGSMLLGMLVAISTLSGVARNPIPPVGGDFAVILILHHRLLEIGHGYRQAVLLMYLWSVLIAASGLAVGFIDGRLAAGAVMLGAVVLFLVTALPRLADRRPDGGEGLAAGSAPDASGAPGQRLPGASSEPGK
ncbi:MAG: undecaprenyl/decaprenyl-phosphate alpha-N-acetylglucosaminyl 1-phosphate transferase [Actinobacteria bacterium]|nr:undecaprenyl/decaprenyl-phosphate alpha-N-acetylglucosaminyl 1-phosphate transferase [Actinomycetota bacterium]